ncbi:F-box/LRR-repeat protein 17 [Seriola lalandi dorsalis]|uniref:F-box and leucine rich repeat protein 17 n=1 Tax=Seriola lalandi dorsalis TaxID=1841481 RepID=A0A3B4Y8S3_SERLL|nr:F-box/LRR-repeat protein 17 [Seriola lalandi dorsalis]XP_056231682.1 F-box/LRR-repeat protein 17 [Seriola aureovittata]
MGHLLSKNGYRLKKRPRKLHHRKKKKRNCFLQGPCMLCFIVHSNSSSLDDDNNHLEAGVNGSGCRHNSVTGISVPGVGGVGIGAVAASKLAERYATLTSPEDCSKFLLSPRELSIWEGQGRSLLSAVPAKLIPPPALFRTAGVSVTVPIPVPVPGCTSDYTEMVCKRKCSEVQRCTPCKQPRCAFAAPDGGLENGGVGGGGGEAASNSETGHCHLPLCPLPSSSSSSSSASSSSSSPADGCCGLGLHADLPHSSDSSPCCLHHYDECQARSSDAADHLSINHLPSSILLKVLSHLTVKERCLCASLVCKYWRDLCLDFQFWKQIDLSGLQQVNDDLLVKIASRRQNVTEINISDCRGVHDHGVSSLASHCPGLQKYTAYRCKQLGDMSLSALATHCPLLVKVHVGNQDKLTDNALKKLGEHCSELKDIHLGQCYSITDEGMVALARGCPKLQRLYLQENKLVTDRSVQAVAEHCPELQFVGFMGCPVTSQGVIHLTALRNLSVLDLRHISELNNETVMEVVRKCRNLSSLNLCLNWSINDRCVEIIAKEGRSLKELYLVSCKITDHALIAIGQYSSTIETVDAGWCKDITDQGATQIAQSSKSLRYLGLMRCDKVNEETVERLVVQYPHIVFSTVMQDCKRTLERAYQMGWSPNTSNTS